MPGRSSPGRRRKPGDGLAVGHAKRADGQGETILEGGLDGPEAEQERIRAAGPITTPWREDVDVVELGRE
jgi:hypothetical protein